MMKRWAGLVKWGEETELVEVEATNYQMAKATLVEKLINDYQPGWDIHAIETVDSMVFGGVTTWSLK